MSSEQDEDRLRQTDAARDPSTSHSEPSNQVQEPTPEPEDSQNSPGLDFVIVSMDDVKRPKMAEAPGHMNSLHPMTGILTISDLESCCVLEEAAFEKPEERCTREKFIYRLKTCGELSLGVFTTVIPGSLNAATLATSRLVETGRENGARHVLLAHIVATRTTGNVVSDEAMDIPAGWNSGNPIASTAGHREEGRTICLHSLAVLPNFQGKSIGRTLLLAYIGMMNGSGIADRIALICHEHMIPYYEKLKFVNKGPSKSKFGGGDWFDMVYDLQPSKAVARYG